MHRKINFNSGPAALPETVLQQVADAVIAYGNTDMSLLELPHRGKDFAAIIAESKQLVKELCELNDDYEVLWLHGGGRLQFCMIPMNFIGEDESAGYIDSGHWAEEAMEYATHYGDVLLLASSKTTNYSCLPEWPETIPAQLAYLHLTTNNTIYGTQWHNVPKINVPLIADMSSDIFSMKRDYSQYAMFYAAVQKNLGTGGTALAVIRRDMLDRITRTLPPMLSYKAQVKENSILNTANVSGVYTSLLMLRWIKEQGIDNIERANIHKAKLLYDALDSSTVFKTHVTEKKDRSMMNVCFTANTPEQENSFLALCEDNNITGIEGHRSVGGFRASIYNVAKTEDVQLLAELIKNTNS